MLNGIAWDGNSSRIFGKPLFNISSNSDRDELILYIVCYIVRSYRNCHLHYLVLHV